MSTLQRDHFGGGEKKGYITDEGARVVLTVRERVLGQKHPMSTAGEKMRRKWLNHRQSPTVS